MIVIEILLLWGWSNLALSRPADYRNARARKKDVEAAKDKKTDGAADSAEKGKPPSASKTAQTKVKEQKQHGVAAAAKDRAKTRGKAMRQRGRPAVHIEQNLKNMPSKQLLEMARRWGRAEREVSGCDKSDLVAMILADQKTAELD